MKGQILKHSLEMHELLNRSHLGLEVNRLFRILILTSKLDMILKQLIDHTSCVKELEKVQCARAVW